MLQGNRSIPASGGSGNGNITPMPMKFLLYVYFEYREEMSRFFRRKDTRNNIVKDLYNSLSYHGISVYEDNIAEFHQGKQTLLDAMERSRFVIIVISKNYLQPEGIIRITIFFINLLKSQHLSPNGHVMDRIRGYSSCKKG
ncbi:hypothetical protein L6452_20229 [Arctium lappa]|uniref:Uncharacterized protein n=1 Tax=Arctium lappa TaxID=4217 RepID=A0ACB9BA22_ARCLA|nr:hypothetical protein L6452_20229 [Arctium lappa]